MCRSCDDWMTSGRMARREFRQNHGGGPEEMPYRKKGRGKKYCNKNKGPHVYDTFTEWRTYGSYRYRYVACKCGKHSWTRSHTQYLKEVTYIIDGEKVVDKVWM